MFELERLKEAREPTPQGDRSWPLLGQARQKAFRPRTDAGRLGSGWTASFRPCQLHLRAVRAGAGGAVAAGPVHEGGLSGGLVTRATAPGPKGAVLEGPAVGEAERPGLRASTVHGVEVGRGGSFVLAGGEGHDARHRRGGRVA